MTNLGTGKRKFIITFRFILTYRHKSVNSYYYFVRIDILCYVKISSFSVKLTLFCQISSETDAQDISLVQAALVNSKNQLMFYT